MKPIEIGEFQIATPCEKTWESMESMAPDRRFCEQCLHVVHDLTGMSESQLAALYARNGGKLCGFFTMDADGHPIYYQNQGLPRKPRFLKHFAAAASMFLLYQTPQSSGKACIPAANASFATPLPSSLLSKPAVTETITPANNTLLSAVILAQDSSEIRDSLRVDVFAKGERITKLYSEAGLVHVDFGNELKPTDEIKIVVHDCVFDQGLRYRERKYHGASLTTTLGNAQNLQIVVQYTAPERPQKLGGVVSHR